MACDGRLEVTGVPEATGAGEEAGFVPSVGEGPAEAEGEGEGLGVGVGHGFSSDVHSCQEAVSLPPNSFQRARQRSLQWA